MIITNNHNKPHYFCAGPSVSRAHSQVRAVAPILYIKSSPALIILATNSRACGHFPKPISISNETPSPFCTLIKVDNPAEGSSCTWIELVINKTLTLCICICTKKGGCPGCKITNAINRQVISPDMKAVHAAGDRSNKQTRNRALNLGHRSNKKRTHEPAAYNKEQNTLW
jgi:hypothetical protein